MIMMMMLMMQEGEVEEDQGNTYDFGLEEEEDVRAHSTRAEDFNFSESIKSIQSVQGCKTFAN